MKARRLFTTSVILLCISFSLLASKTLEGGKMFSKPVKSYRGEALQGNTTAAKTDIVSTFTMDRTYADNAFEINSTNLEIRNFPINTKENADVVLEKAPSIIDANTIWIADGADGEKRFQGPAIISFRGKIKNNPSSKVFLSYSGGYLTGYVESGDGYKYDITTAKEEYLKGRSVISIAEQNYNNIGKEATEIFKDYSDEESLQGFIDGLTEDDIMKGADNEVQGWKTGLLECKIAIDAEYSYFKLMGNDSLVAARYIASVMSHVSYIYEEYLNVRITVPYVIIRTTEASDPYIKNNKKTFTEKLYYMITLWSTLPNNSALVCLFCSLRSTQDGSATAGISCGGVPGTGSLCNAIDKRGYSVFGIEGSYTYPNYNYTWDVSVAAHEIGHNFGAPHTHSCYYKPNMIDTCVTKTKPLAVGDACLDGDYIPRLGTIMSYCHVGNETHSVDLSFHPREIGHMRKAAYSAFCIKDITDPFISLLYPVSNPTFIAGKTTTIRWTSANIANVAIRYSIDNGSNWITITESTPANDTTFDWSIPEASSDKCLLIVADASDATIADTTKINFKIGTPTIECINPGDGKHYGNRETIKISWNASISSVFNVEYTTDGGTNWTMIGHALTGNDLLWEIPDVISNECYIRISDNDNAKVIDLSPKFGIGVETLTLVYPEPGDTLCAGFQYEVKWKSDYVNSIYIAYSYDNGNTWKKHFSLLDATTGFFKWTVPAGYHENVILKALLADDQSVVLYQMTTPFLIDTCEANSVIETEVPGFLFRIVSLVPNPVNSSATVYYECQDETIGSVELYVVNMLGQIVGSTSSVRIDCGLNSVSYDFSSLPQGSYILCARKDGSITGLPFVVGR